MAILPFLVLSLAVAQVYGKIAIGIDFGATTKISIITHKRPSNIDFVNDESSNVKIPSIVAFSSSGMFFGQQAAKMMGKSGVKSVSLMEELIRSENPWTTSYQDPNTPENLFTVSALYFEYVKFLCDEYIAKLFGSNKSPDSLVISVCSIVFLILGVQKT
jgi:hypothetical protein